MSEVKEQAVTPPQVQARLYEEFMRLRELLDMIDLGKRLNYQEHLELLRLVMFFSDILYNELVNSRLKGVKGAINWLDLYRVNKQEFARSPFASWIVSYKARGDTAASRVVVYNSYDSFIADKKSMEEKDMVVASVILVPSLELLKVIGRAIVIRALDLGILGFRIVKKPEFWYGDE